MQALFGGLAALGAVLFLIWAFTRMPTRTAAQSLRVTMGVLGCIVGAGLTVRGLAILGVPLIGVSLGLLGAALHGGPKKRRGGSGGRASRSWGSGGMSRAEARDILGVPPDADAATIRKAYRDRMKEAHPDAGGSDEAAARVQDARDVLLGE
ncbi:MAG: J domain-containing protein [Pseudomonadota bacterium]